MKNDPIKGKGRTVFYAIVQFFGKYYIIVSLAIAIAMLFVKDANKYGVKFECLSTAIISIIVSPLTSLLQQYVTSKNKPDEYKPKIKFLLELYNVTNGGKFLFNIIGIYILFTSIILPLIHYYKSKREKAKYFQQPMSSLQYFYKVLNTPALVNELREIAIKEFSVENVLFWDNYQILQKMVYRYQMECDKAKEMNDDKFITNFDIENTLQELIGFSQLPDNMENYSYDPFMAIPKEIIPYYVSFYYTFIHFDGPCAVNLSGSTMAKIKNEMNSYPTVGIFDIAKNEVVEMMYTSIFPILLKSNIKHFELTLC